MVVLTAPWRRTGDRFSAHWWRCLLCVVPLFSLLGGCGRAASPSSQQGATVTRSSTVPPTAVATFLLTPSPRPFDIGVFPLPNGRVVEMVRIPAGEFQMGSPAGVGEEDERPQHNPYLDSYWIDRTEVTNSQYAGCVEAGACPSDHPVISFQYLQYFGHPAFNSHPVLYVSWEEGQAFCAWAGKRLPTEAEWERAARGTDGRIYPWGDEFDPNRGNFAGVVGDTVEVGQYPSGASPYGVKDMAGNAAEWVADWYSADYYRRSPQGNPMGPESGQERVVRGGSWAFYSLEIRTADRTSRPPSERTEAIGLRCAKNSP